MGLLLSGYYYRVEMKEVDHAGLERAFRRHYDKLKPLFIHGTTGIGKSDTVRSQAKQIASDKGREYVEWHSLSEEEKRNVINRKEDIFILFDIRLASYDPSDINGIPKLDEDVLRFAPPEWVNTICTEGVHGVVFLDEANLAPPLVQSSLYQLVLDRKVGSYRVSDGVHVVAAGNREGKDRANIHKTAAPLSNRFGHVKLRPPTAGEPHPEQGQGTWTAWAIENDLDERVVGYLASGVGEAHLFTFDEDNSDAHSFATPRSWETVGEMLSEDDTPEDAGFWASIWVGEGVGTEFEAFLELREEADIQSYLDNPEKAKELNDAKFDVKHAVMTGVAAKYRDSPDETLRPIIQFATHLDKEYAVSTLRLCKEYNEDHLLNTLRSGDIPEWKKLGQDIGKHFL